MSRFLIINQTEVNGESFKIRLSYTSTYIEIYLPYPYTAVHGSCFKPLYKSLPTSSSSRYARHVFLVCFKFSVLIINNGFSRYPQPMMGIFILPVNGRIRRYLAKMIWCFWLVCKIVYILKHKVFYWIHFLAVLLWLSLYLPALWTNISSHSWTNFTAFGMPRRNDIPYHWHR